MNLIRLQLHCQARKWHNLVNGSYNLYEFQTSFWMISTSSIVNLFSLMTKERGFWTHLSFTAFCDSEIWLISNFWSKYVVTKKNQLDFNLLLNFNSLYNVNLLLFFWLRDFFFDFLLGILNKCSNLCLFNNIRENCLASLFSIFLTLVSKIG